MLDDGQVEWSDGGGSDGRHCLRHPTRAEASYPGQHRAAAASPGFLLGAGRGHEPVASRELGIVRLLVSLEYRGPGERFAAQRAPERPFASVHATVVFHVVPQFERFAAKLALEWPVAGVRGQMAHQGGHVREGLAAKLAHRATPAVVERGCRAVAVRL